MLTVRHEPGRVSPGWHGLIYNESVRCHTITVNLFFFSGRFLGVSNPFRKMVNLHAICTQIHNLPHSWIDSVSRTHNATTVVVTSPFRVCGCVYVGTLMVPVEARRTNLALDSYTHVRLVTDCAGLACASNRTSQLTNLIKRFGSTRKQFDNSDSVSFY
jgi:hypothetical protein